MRPGSRTSAPGNVTFVQADCENAGPTSASANAATSVLDKGAPAAGASAPARPKTMPPAVRARSAATLRTVRTFCTRVPALRPSAFVAVRARTTAAATAFIAPPATDGTRSPRNVAKATATAAIVPVWMTSAIVQP